MWARLLLGAASSRKPCLCAPHAPELAHERHDPSPRRRPAPSLDPMMALVAQDHEPRQRSHPRPHAIEHSADPRAGRPSDRRRRQADAPDADARERAKLLGYSGARHHKLAAAVEFIHTATLLHDDVVDGSDLRRGRRTANIIWGNPASVLVGDFLFSRSFELMVEDGSLKVLKILSQRQRRDRRGRSQPAHRGAPARHFSEAALSRHHRRQDRRPVRRRLPHRRSRRRTRRRSRKPRSTPMAATSASRSSWSTTRSITSRTPRTMGKDAGDDFREGKMTLPVILAYARGDEARAPSGRRDRRAIARRTRISPRRSAAPRQPRGRRHARPRPPLRPARDRCARRLRGGRGQGCDGRSRRVRGGPRLLRITPREPVRRRHHPRRGHLPRPRRALPRSLR
jgi:octaprenyl-diphosphate synthase